MFIHILATLILSINSVSGEKPVIPKTHVKVLDGILLKHVNASYQTSLLDLLLGDTALSSDITENLFVNVLDYDSLKSIILTSQNKHYEEHYRREAQKIVLEAPPDMVNKTFDLMRQSIYATRFRLNATKALRIRYKDDIPYNIAILVGNIQQLIHKSENLFALLGEFPRRTHFLRYLTIYEKVLSAHTDVTDMVRRIFEYQGKHLEAMANLASTASADSNPEVLGEEGMPQPHRPSTTGPPNQKPVVPEYANLRPPGPG